MFIARRCDALIAMVKNTFGFGLALFSLFVNMFCLGC